MKKLAILATALLVVASMTVQAQNKFRGIVKYKLESTGTTSFQIPAEQQTVELKVYDDQLFMSSKLQNGYKVTTNADFSPYISYLAANDIELETYTGDGKFLIRETHSKAEADSLSIVDNAPGHFYFEYVAGETQEMVGMTAKKAILHVFDEDSGEDNPITFWYTDEIGPEYNFLFNGIKGVPLKFEQQLGEGKAVTYTCTEIVKGKVKDVDMLLPAGFKEATEEEFNKFMKELQEAIELLGDE